MAETRLGIIGVGGFGLFCLDKYRFIPEVRITYAADINQEPLRRLSAAYDIPHVTTDWRELIASPEVDVVHIATPPSLHAEQAIAAVTAGKHVFCEKPLALSMEDADEMLSAAEARHVRVGIDFVMRYSRLYDQVHTVVGEGLLGAPQRILFENNAKDLPAGHWFWNPSLSGGIPVEHGVHFFDIFEYLFGRGLLCWAGRTIRSSGEADRWMAVFRYGERAFGSFYHGFDKPGIIERTWALFELSRGHIRLEGWIPERLTLEGVATRDELKSLTAIFPNLEVEELDEGAMTVLADGQEVIVSHRVRAEVSAGEKLVIYGQAVQDAMADFIAWTRDPRHQPRVTGEDGQRALAVALEVTAAARG